MKLARRPRSGIGLRFELQFGLTNVGKKNHGAGHHGWTRAMLRSWKDDQILQKNIIKSNGEFKKHAEKLRDDKQFKARLWSRPR
jgi:hypothetical protein